MRKNGFSLIEVMVSLLLVSLILFGLDAVELQSMQQAKIAYFYGVAANQLENMAERLYSLKNNRDVSDQLLVWNGENAEVLPEGVGAIEGEYPQYTLSISWGGQSQQCGKNRIGTRGCLRKKIWLG